MIDRILNCLTLTMAATLIGCSASQPSVDDGRQVIVERIIAQSGGRIRLANFRKTDGIAAEGHGMKFYTMKFEVRIEFTEDCQWFAVPKFNRSSDIFRTKAGHAPPRTSPLSMSGWNQNKGGFATITGTIDFRKTENGWGGDELYELYVHGSY